MARFRERFDARFYRPVEALLEALVASYREWGGTASPPLMAIVDWREVPTFSEFEILRDAFTALGVPTIICDPRDLESRRAAAPARPASTRSGERIDLVYRRVLINDIVAREAECRALLDAYEQRAVCVANSLRCKIPHKKAFFAVLTDERHAALFSADERELIRRHIPWTRVVEERPVVARRRDDRSAAAPARAPRAVRHQAERRVRRHRRHARMGDQRVGRGTTAIARGARASAIAAGWRRSGSRSAARCFRSASGGGGARMRDMLVDFAPYHLPRHASPGF